MAEGIARITGTLIPDDVVSMKWDEEDDSYFTITEEGEGDDVQLIDGEITVIEGTRVQIVTSTLNRTDGIDSDACFESAEDLLSDVIKAGGSIEGTITFMGDLDNGEKPFRVVFRPGVVDLEWPRLTWSDGTDAED